MSLFQSNKLNFIGLLFFFNILVVGCSGNSDSDNPSGGGSSSSSSSSSSSGSGAINRFVDVSSTHLNFAELSERSMDVAAGDLDNDGDIDFIVAREFASNLLLLGDGTGAFRLAEPGRLPETTHDSEDIALADFDNDGDLDIVIVSEDDEVNEFYLNDGTAFFTAENQRIPTGGNSNGIAVADLNNDGALDIIIGNKGQNNLLLNDGNGFFTDATNQRLPELNDITQDIELGDVDNDGDLDLLIGNEGNNALQINNGQGFFTDESDLRLAFRQEAEETREADFGDIDGDGDLDILFANIRFEVSTAERRNRLLQNDGTGIFTDITLSALPRDRNLSFDGDFADLDGDGDLDIVTANGVSRLAPYRIYENDGTGNFVEETERLLPSNPIGLGFDVEFVDVNNDSLPDLYLAGRNSQDFLLLAE